MGDWASEFGGDIALFERRQDERHALEAHQDFRSNTWRTKDKREMCIKDMDDAHLLNAYKQSGRSDLFKEMVVRLFESKITEKGLYYER